MPIPYALRRFTFDFLASVVCLRELKNTHGTDVHIPEHHEKNTNVWSSRLCPSSSVARLKLLNGGIPACHGVVHKDNGNCECKSCSNCCAEEQFDKIDQQKGKSDQLQNAKTLQSIDVHLKQILEALGEYENRRIESATSEFRIAEWKAVGKVYDRFFFIIFVMIMLIITVIFLLPPSPDDVSLSELKVATGRPTPTIT